MINKETTTKENAPAKTESRLIYEIMRELGKHGSVFRTNSGSVRLPNGRTFRGLPAGFSDLMFIAPGGRACFIECKTGRNKASPAQIAFLEKMRRLGCRAGIAYSVDEAVEICGLSGTEQNVGLQKG